MSIHCESEFQQKCGCQNCEDTRREPGSVNSGVQAMRSLGFLGLIMLAIIVGVKLF